MNGVITLGAQMILIYSENEQQRQTTRNYANVNWTNYYNSNCKSIDYESNDKKTRLRD
jgi:hypothetical protein